MYPEMTDTMIGLLQQYRVACGEDVGILCVNAMPQDELERRLREAIAAGKPIPYSDKTFYEDLPADHWI